MELRYVDLQERYRTLLMYDIEVRERRIPPLTWENQHSVYFPSTCLKEPEIFRHLNMYLLTHSSLCVRSLIRLDPFPPHSISPFFCRAPGFGPGGLPLRSAFPTILFHVVFDRPAFPFPPGCHSSPPASHCSSILSTSPVRFHLLLGILLISAVNWLPKFELMPCWESFHHRGAVCFDRLIRTRNFLTVSASNFQTF